MFFKLKYYMTLQIRELKAIDAKLRVKLYIEFIKLKKKPELLNTNNPKHF